MKFIEKCIISVSGIALILTTFVPMGRAETPFDITECHSGIVKPMYLSEPLRIFSAEGFGIVMSNHENKVFHNFTVHIMAIGQIMPGKTMESGYSKLIDPEGDIIMMEFSRVEPEGVSKILYGTGKWKGIKGSGKVRAITRGKPITPGTFQGCSRWTGTFELPK